MKIHRPDTISDFHGGTIRIQFIQSKASSQARGPLGRQAAALPKAFTWRHQGLCVENTDWKPENHKITPSREAVKVY